MSLLIHQTNQKPFALQGPTSSHTPHLHLLMRKTSQGKEFQKSAQRSKTRRLSPFHLIPKMKVPRARSLFPSNEDKAFILSPSPKDECPENILPPRDDLLDEDELSFLNLSIPILPPPMPSLQLLHHAPLPFPPAAPLACSTPCITTPTPSPPPKESEGKRAAKVLHRNKRGRESHSATEHVSKKRKRNHKAVAKNINAKELMLKRRHRQ